jgi:hypothetical protein
MSITHEVIKSSCIPAAQTSSSVNLVLLLLHLSNKNEVQCSSEDTVVGPCVGLDCYKIEFCLKKRLLHFNCKYPRRGYYVYNHHSYHFYIILGKSLLFE